jgi:DNA polymerase III epsilon subunit-like protein
MPHDAGYIIIDTEGTGLFRHKNEDGTTRASDAPGQPRMAAFAAVLTDADLNVTAQYSAFIKPEGWLNADGSPMLEMPQGAFDVHGLSMDFLRENGVPTQLALEIYVRAVGNGRAVLGFNQQHDGRQVRAELRHAGLSDMFEQTQTVCAMRSMQAAKLKVKKLNGKGGWPRLVDACAHFGIHYPENVRHKPLEDALACREVGLHLHQLGLLLPAEVHYAKDYQGGKEQII